MEKVKPVISSVLQQESKTRWSRCNVAEIKSARSKSNEAGWDSDESHDAMEEKILARIWESLLNCPGMEQIEPGIGQLLVDQAKTAIAMKKYYFLNCCPFKLQLLIFFYLYTGLSVKCGKILQRI